MQRHLMIVRIALAAILACGSATADSDVGPESVVQGWLHWRGPHQNGTSDETNLPDRLHPDESNHCWSLDLAGRGTPVIARYAGEDVAGGGDRVYVWGYRGEQADLAEVLACLDANTGRTIWEHSFADFISDIIYNRYSIGSPTVDPQTGNVYLMTTPGLLMGFDQNGHMLWQRSTMEEFGRLTFPNGRTGAPSINGSLVIVNAISTNWGREGPARNRLYAFNKHSGELVWSSTPGVGPPFLKDSSFCSPVFDWRNGRRVFYAGTGCGNIVCVNADTGTPIWRYQLAIGGVNSSVVLHGDNVIAIHGKENVDDTGRGRMVAINTKKAFDYVSSLPLCDSPQVAIPLDVSYESWRNNDLSMFTSSPVIVENRIYQVTSNGDLICVDAESGKTRWRKKLGADQLHASPLYADGKLYVPMWNNGLYIIKPTEEGAQVLDHVELQGQCIGSPSVWNGQIYLHTTKKLYCFGQGNEGSDSTIVESDHAATKGKHANGLIQAVPAEVLMRPGDTVNFVLHYRDRAGQNVTPETNVEWRKFVPSKAKVVSYLDAEFTETGKLVAGSDAERSAGAFEVTADGLKGYIRGRVLPSPPYSEDFESFILTQTNQAGVKFAYPPLPWIGSRLKWEIHDLDGNKVLAKTLDRVLFQRSMVFIGHADDRNYTVEVDLMSDGNRRGMSTAGVVNQRYVIALVGNAQVLEVSSNHDRIKVSVPFKWQPNKWYRLKTRVDVSKDGAGVVRAKAWQRDKPQPDDWTIEVPHRRAHQAGSPGLFGFSPQSRFHVYLDNLTVTSN